MDRMDIALDKYLTTPPPGWDDPEPLTELVEAARALLTKIDNMTTEQFQHGGERIERETLRKALAIMDSEQYEADMAQEHYEAESERYWEAKLDSLRDLADTLDEERDMALYPPDDIPF